MDCAHFQSLPTCKLILKNQFKGIVLIVFILVSELVQTSAFFKLTAYFTELFLGYISADSGFP